MTVTPVHDEATPEARRVARLSFVRSSSSEGHTSVDGVVASSALPATVDLEPGSYALFAQSLYEATCAVELVRVPEGDDLALAPRLRPGRRVSVSFGAAALAAVEPPHFLVLQDGEPILVQFAGPLAADLVLPARDLDFELHAAGCENVSRRPLSRGVDVLHIP